MSQYFVDSCKMSTEVCNPPFYERKQAKTFSSLDRLPFFFPKIVFSTTSKILKKLSINFHSKCQNTLVTLKNFSLKIVMFDKRRKNSPKFFLHWKVGLFFKSLCFQQSLGCYRNYLISSPFIARIPLGPLPIVRRDLSHSIKSEKLLQKLSLHPKDCLFIPEITDFNNL